MNLEEELVVGDPNDYFDELASKRWRRKGDSHGLLLCCRPRMGGLPDAAACAMLEQNQVKLIVSCFQDFCTQRGGSIPRGAFQIKFNYTAQMLRDKHWDPGALKFGAGAWHLCPLLSRMPQSSSGSGYAHLLFARQVF